MVKTLKQKLLTELLFVLTAGVMFFQQKKPRGGVEQIPSDGEELCVTKTLKRFYPKNTLISRVFFIIIFKRIDAFEFYPHFCYTTPTMNDEENKIIDEPIDDVVFEDTAEGEGEVLSKDKIKKLREELKESKAKEMEYLTNWQRERADFQNYKKDETARMKSGAQRIQESLIESLLPVLDSYDMAFANREAWEKVDQNWRMGVEYIHAQLLKVLAENGVTPIETKVGDMVDANLHEAMESIATEDTTQDQKIAVIIQQGYKLGERVLRPARVKVWGVK